MLKFLGFMDLLAGFLFVLIKLGINEIILTVLFWICVIYLLIKVFSFPFTFGAVGDAVSLFILFISFFSGVTLFSWIAMIWFIQKGIMSIAY